MEWPFFYLEEHFIKGRAWESTVLEESFARLFPEQGYFLEGLFLEHRPNGVAHLRSILGLAELYPAEAMISAFQAAREYNTYSHSFVSGVLESRGMAGQQSVPPMPLHPSARSVVVSLRTYHRILEAGR